jgi:hypothetical protein
VKYTHKSLLVLGILGPLYAYSGSADIAFNSLATCYSAGLPGLCSFLSVDSSGESLEIKDQMTGGGQVIVLDSGYRATVDSGYDGVDISGSNTDIADAGETEIRLSLPKSQELLTWSGSIEQGGLGFKSVVDVIEQSYIGQAVAESQAPYFVGVKWTFKYLIETRSQVLRRIPSGGYTNRWGGLQWANDFNWSADALSYTRYRNGQQPTTVTSAAAYRVNIDHNWNSYWNSATPNAFSTSPECTWNYSNIDPSDWFNAPAGYLTLEAVCWATVDVLDVTNGTLPIENLMIAFQPIFYENLATDRLYSGSGECQWILASPEGTNAYSDEPRCGSGTEWSSQNGYGNVDFDPVRFAWGSTIQATAEVYGYVD